MVTQVDPRRLESSGNTVDYGQYSVRHSLRANSRGQESQHIRGHE